MAKEKPVCLLGVFHNQPEAVDEALKRIFSRAKTGQSVGIEVSPEILKEFERIRQLQARQDISFEEAFKDFCLEEIRTDLKVIGHPENEIKEFIESYTLEEIKEVAIHSFYWYKVFKGLKEKGLKPVALDRKANVRKVNQALLKQGFLADAQGKIKPEDALRYLWYGRAQDFLVIPIRERLLMEQITAKKPDFIMVGLKHLEDIKNRLRKQGVKTRTIYSGKLSAEEVAEARYIRSQYWATRKKRRREPEKALKERLERLRRRRARKRLK